MLGTASGAGGTGRRCSADLRGRAQNGGGGGVMQAGRHKLSWSISGMSVS